LLFGSLLFAAPVFLRALFDREGDDRVSVPKFLARSIAAAVLIGGAIAIVLLPFWIALYAYPVTQTPIPHPSRANYILSPQWGLNYFVIPYGALMLALPFIIWRGARTPRLRPLLFGFWLAFLLGLGGTTPLGSLVLGRAFEVITMERFTYWATLLSLPFVGLLAEELIDRFRFRAVVGLALAAGFTCALAVGWSTYHPADAADFKVNSIAAWLDRDGHDNYRYITLGFGNKISRLAVLTDASSLDGEWNSGRMLPELTEHGGGALTSSKYFGKGGIDALTSVLRHADHYGLKWVFARDPYYEPLLVFAGWRKVDDLEDRTISVWSKDNIAPAVPMNTPQVPPPWQGLMWGTLPIGSSIVALLLVLIPDKKRAAVTVPESESADRDLIYGRLIS
jgi:hypothetical protein